MLDPFTRLACRIVGVLVSRNPDINVAGLQLLVCGEMFVSAGYCHEDAFADA